MIRRIAAAILPAGHIGRALAIIAVLLLALWVAMFLRDLLTTRQRTEARLGNEQGHAAIESGRDAIGTATAARRREDDLDRKTREIQDEVNDAPDGRAADIAGRNGLCHAHNICGEDGMYRPDPR